MRPLWLFLLSFFTLGASAAEPTGAKFHPLTETFGPAGSPESLHYLLYLPETYEKETSKKWPLVIFLHGSGERGTDINSVRKNGLPHELDQRGTTPYILIAPQCPANTKWNIANLDGMLSDALKRYRIDTQRVIITGLSLGGFGSWGWACAHPERFAGVIPVCGGIDPAQTVTLKGMPIWGFHGDKDGSVKIEGHLAAIEAAKKNGADVKFTVYPGVGHNSWEKAYAEPELEGWILARVRK